METSINAALLKIYTLDTAITDTKANKKPLKESVSFMRQR